MKMSQLQCQRRNTSFTSYKIYNITHPKIKTQLQFADIFLRNTVGKYARLEIFQPNPRDLTITAKTGMLWWKRLATYTDPITENTDIRKIVTDLVVRVINKR